MANGNERNIYLNDSYKKLRGFVRNFEELLREKRLIHRLTNDKKKQLQELYLDSHQVYVDYTLKRREDLNIINELSDFITTYNNILENSGYLEFFPANGFMPEDRARIMAQEENNNDDTQNLEKLQAAIREKEKEAGIFKATPVKGDSQTNTPKDGIADGVLPTGANSPTITLSPEDARRLEFILETAPPILAEREAQLEAGSAIIPEELAEQGAQLATGSPIISEESAEGEAHSDVSMWTQPEEDQHQQTYSADGNWLQDILDHIENIIYYIEQTNDYIPEDLNSFISLRDDIQNYLNNRFGLDNAEQREAFTNRYFSLIRDTQVIDFNSHQSDSDSISSSTAENTIEAHDTPADDRLDQQPINPDTVPAQQLAANNNQPDNDSVSSAYSHQSSNSSVSSAYSHQSDSASVSSIISSYSFLDETMSNTSANTVPAQQEETHRPQNNRGLNMAAQNDFNNRPYTNNNKTKKGFRKKITKFAGKFNPFKQCMGQKSKRQGA